MRENSTFYFNWYSKSQNRKNIQNLFVVCQSLVRCAYSSQHVYHKLMAISTFLLDRFLRKGTVDEVCFHAIIVSEVCTLHNFLTFCQSRQGLNYK